MGNIHKVPTSRITTQQQAILQVIRRFSASHLTAEQVYSQVSKTLPRISLATVYRNLEKLSSSNIIGKVTINGIYYFESEISLHYHVVCQACGRLNNLEVPLASDIEEFFTHHTTYKLTGHHLILFGLCPDCLKKQR